MKNIDKRKFVLIKIVTENHKRELINMYYDGNLSKGIEYYGTEKEVRKELDRLLGDTHDCMLITKDTMPDADNFYDEGWYDSNGRFIAEKEPDNVEIDYITYMVQPLIDVMDETMYCFDSEYYHQLKSVITDIIKRGINQ